MVQAGAMIVNSIWLVGLHLLVQAAVILRVIQRPNREPASRIAWVVVVLAVPVAGIFAYLMLGETSIGRRNQKAMKAIIHEVRERASEHAENVDIDPGIPPLYAHLFRVGHSISGFPPVPGNRAQLMDGSVATIDSMVADIDAARCQVSVLFYIWLTDGSGTRVAQALQRAAGRGVTCRVMVDGLGSRALLKSSLWEPMRAAGVRTAVALPLGNVLLRPLQGRVDLRNHRKILVIDSYITYCGSQNCADQEFRVKARYAPWVDAVVRLEGPIARQNELLFATDWAVYTGEDAPADEVAECEAAAHADGTIAQVVASGPTLRPTAMPELFVSLMFTARRELVISTPYYVPNQAMQSALCAAAYRGVQTTLILPAKNDSREVAGASRSYYAELLQSGVRIREYEGGLLHSKTLTLDGDITLIGSANMDRRSFELNFENNILLYDPQLTAAVRLRQQCYIESAKVVTVEEVEAWPLHRRLWNNCVAMLGPIL
jgi:cardiolipin synthase